MKIIGDLLWAIAVALVVSALTVFMTAVFLWKARGGHAEIQAEIREIDKVRTWATIDSPWREDADRERIRLEEKSWMIFNDTVWKPLETK
jgi:membrane protein implicated in regulation of membrane protease activity